MSLTSPQKKGQTLPKLGAIREEGSLGSVGNHGQNDERTPLLGHGGSSSFRARADSVLTTTDDKDEHLPYVQLVLICLWRATTPL